MLNCKEYFGCYLLSLMGEPMLFHLDMGGKIEHE
jgi:hypothetical protein